MGYCPEHETIDEGFVCCRLGQARWCSWTSSMGGCVKESRAENNCAMKRHCQIILDENAF